MEVSKEIKQDLLVFQRQDLTGGILYTYLAKKQKLQLNAELLLKMAKDEYEHYDLFKKYTGTDIKPYYIQILKFKILEFLLGITFAVKVLERQESLAQGAYVKQGALPGMAKVIQDEAKHEEDLSDFLKEDRLNYIGSVVLGLNDALVELTGALAGLTFALQDPDLIALTGTITGVAAAFSMAASEYLSIKTEENSKSPLKASFYTGLAYISTVVILILPFLILNNVFVSLGLTLVGAVLIIASFNYYYTTVKNECFKRRFTEMLALSFGVAALSFGAGILLKKFFNVEL